MVTAAPPLLFDLDGTLTDNYPGIARSIRYALARLDTPDPEESVLRRCVGPPLRESFAWLLDTNDPGFIEHAIALYRERFAEIGWRENSVYDGVPEMMATLAEDTSPMYVCTSKPEVFARRIVTLFGFAECLDGIYGADLAGNFDDKAKLVAHIAATERFDPGQAIMIGDRSHDIRAARMNGARSVGVLWGYGSRDELRGATAVVANPGELPLALANLATP